jgi:hypothetical protein
MVGVLMLVYVAEKLVPDIKELQTGSAAVGIMGMMVCDNFYFSC